MTPQGTTRKTCILFSIKSYVVFYFEETTLPFWNKKRLLCSYFNTDRWWKIGRWWWLSQVIALKIYSSVTKGLKLKHIVLRVNSYVWRSYKGKTGKNEPFHVHLFLILSTFNTLKPYEWVPNLVENCLKFFFKSNNNKNGKSM